MTKQQIRLVVRQQIQIVETAAETIQSMADQQKRFTVKDCPLNQTGHDSQHEFDASLVFGQKYCDFCRKEWPRA